MADCTKTFITGYRDPASLVSLFDTQLHSINGVETSQLELVKK
jgi:hypothetical protein